MESLFTNVPVDETIEIILQYVYNHPSLPPLHIERDVLTELLRLCTKEIPFRHPNGQLFQQIDGIAMGSPLGPIFAAFYMGHLESKVFSGSEGKKPILYARYVDDIFVMCRDTSELHRLKDAFQNNSVLNFTYELSNIREQLAFLDVLVTNTANGLHLGAYVKPTDSGSCMSGDSYCPDKYKKSVIMNYLSRSYAVSEDWTAFHAEVERIKVLLINNNYTNKMVDGVIKSFVRKKLTAPLQQNDGQSCDELTIPLFYRAQMHSNYGLDESILRSIIDNNVRLATGSTHKVNLHIYYNNKKAHSLISKNSPSQLNHVRRTNVVYSFTCPFQHQNPETYIGHTRTTLARRLTMHVQGGSIAAHFASCHNVKLNRTILDENTTIIAYETDPHRLKIKEALYILQRRPTINIQEDKFDRVLHLPIRTDLVANNGDVGTGRFFKSEERNRMSIIENTKPILNNDLSFERSFDEITSDLPKKVSPVATNSTVVLQPERSDLLDGNVDTLDTGRLVPPSGPHIVTDGMVGVRLDRVVILNDIDTLNTERPVPPSSAIRLVPSGSTGAGFVDFWPGRTVTSDPLENGFSCPDDSGGNLTTNVHDRFQHLTDNQNINTRKRRR